MSRFGGVKSITIGGILVFTIVAANHKSWNDSFCKIQKTNLLQTWAYGDAKVSAGNWVIERWIIYTQDEPVALLQVLKKNILGLWSVVRINRGPLWLKEKLSFMIKASAYQLIHQKYSWRNRCLLFLSPNLSAAQENQQLLIRAGYYAFKKQPVGSIWLDLQPSVDALRKALRSNWRGQLVKAEKSDLSCLMVKAQDDLDCLLDQYRLLQQRKGFSGLSLALIKALTQCESVTTFQCTLFKAMRNDEVIAGVLIVRHGLACTYLVGWLDREKGQASNASNFLLWQAMLEMKRRGCLWFDLGGISELQPELASITSFKRGMGGEEFWLLGEHLAF